MITAVDTNILLDLLIPGAADAERAIASLDVCSQAGALVLSPIVVAELGASFPDQSALTSFLRNTGLQVIEPGFPALWEAGRAWKNYAQKRTELSCAQCGTAVCDCLQCGSRLKARQHMLTDFLIGAHALFHADQLLTRDRGYYRTYFPKLQLSR